MAVRVVVVVGKMVVVADIGAYLVSILGFHICHRSLYHFFIIAPLYCGVNDVL